MAKQVEIHPAANLFPLMSADEYTRLRDDIAANGLRESLVFWNNKLVDGRNRLRACEELGIEPGESELDADQDPVDYVISANLHRRQLKTSQRAMCAAKLAGLPHGVHGKTAEELQNCNTLADAGLLFTVSKRSISSALTVLHDGCSELVSMCEMGELSVSAACTLMELTTKPIEKKVAKKGAKAVREYIKAQQCVADDDGPVSDEPHFVKFKALWDVADDTGRAAIRAFVIGSE